MVQTKITPHPMELQGVPRQHAPHRKLIDAFTLIRKERQKLQDTVVWLTWVICGTNDTGLIPHNEKGIPPTYP